MDDLVEPDLCVIGAGCGGLAVAAGAAQMGARAVLIEKGHMGDRQARAVPSVMPWLDQA